MIVHVAVAVSHCCSIRADSDCDIVLQVFCVRSGCAGLYRGLVCNAAPPSCVTTVLTSTLSVQCSGVCSSGAVCLGVCVSVLLFDFRERQCAVVSVCCSVAVCGPSLHWTVAAAVSGCSRTAAVAMRSSLRSECGAVS